MPRNSDLLRPPASGALALTALAVLTWVSAGCGSTPPREPPPLASLEEPLELRDWPDDETERRALPAGGFTGIVAGDARASLDDLVSGGGAPGLRVERVVENSPADAAGVGLDDLLLEARLGEGAWQPLGYVSDWRGLELAGSAGDVLEVRVDRAGAQRTFALELETRVHPAGAPEERRAREERRVGVVLRSATEVEARAAGLAPGAGAVVVGLARESPWRRAGIGYGDLILAVTGEPVRDVRVVTDAIGRGGERLTLEVLQEGERRTLRAPLASRAQEVREVSIPLLFSFERRRGLTTLSMLLGLIEWERTRAAWELELGWFLFTLRGGDADRLREVDA
jgi:C-terminal processing protease CtpA/Prc